MAKILNTSPVTFATSVARNAYLTATFDTDLNRDTVNDLTVLLLKSSDQSVIDGVVDYIPGTRKVVFQQKSLLTADTEYTWILIGRSEGIQTLAGSNALESNVQVSFTTGDTIDGSIPLAAAEVGDGTIEPFQGGDGIYTVVWGRTGEPISHVVTTAASVGPSGLIVPAPLGSEIYLATSGYITPDPIAVSGTYPVNDAHFIDPGAVTNTVVTFTDVPSVSSLPSAGVTIVVEDLLGQPVDQLIFGTDWTTSVSGHELTITPVVGWLGGMEYTLTLSDSITGTTLGAMEDEYEYSFTTLPDYFFTTVRLVRMNLGAAISNITDEEIELLIYENSLWAYNNDVAGFDPDDPPTYINDYVLCKTKRDALNNALMGTDGIQRERMGDVEFQYGGNIEDRFKRKFAEIDACIEEARGQILSGLNGTLMTTTTKSGNYPGRPGRDNSWRRIGNTGDFLSPSNAPGNR